MKLKHRIKRLLFPRKHSDIVRKICRVQLELKIVRAQIERLDRLAEHGILGDSLLDKYNQLIYAGECGRRMIKKLKTEYRTPET